MVKAERAAPLDPARSADHHEDFVVETDGMAGSWLDSCIRFTPSHMHRALLLEVGDPLDR